MVNSVHIGQFYHILRRIRNSTENGGDPSVNFMNIGSVASYVKALDYQRQAEQRSQGSSGKKPSTIKEWIKQQEDTAKSAADRDKNDIVGSITDHLGDQKLAGIQTKFYSGGTLTKSECEYLKSKNPMLYERLVASESEKNAYKQQLRRCRTRDEVHRLKLAHTAGALSSAKADKATAVYKMNGIQSASGEFVRGGEYHALPTEHEQAVAEKRVKQAEERQKRKSSERAEAIATRKESRKTDEDSKKLFQDIRPGETVEQAKNSPEMLKVKRAKAKRAYSRSSDGYKVVISNKA